MSTFVDRPTWGSRNTNRTAWPGAMPELYVHHTAGTYSTNPSQDKATMRSLQAYAIDTKGYSDIDYNLVVGSETGDVMEGRGGGYKSAATLDRNDVSRSICAMGNFENAHPTSNLLNGIVAGAQYLIDHGWLAPNATVRVLGHQQNPAHPGATACPGRYLQERVPDIARMIAAAGKPLPAPTPGDEMTYIYAFKHYANTFSENGVALTPEAYSAMVAKGAVVIVSDNHQQHIDSLLHMSGLTMADMVPK